MNGASSYDDAAALLALDALLPGEQADAELLIGALPADLAGAVALLAEQTVTDPPPGLRSATLARAAARRPAGRPVGAARPCEPAVAFDRTVEDMNELLGSLTDAEWSARAHADHGQVRELLAHLVGVERLVQRWLDPEDDVPVLPDHIASTKPAVAELAGTAPREIARQWYEQARAVSAAAAGDRSRPVAFHDLTITVDQLLVSRTGELWSHAIDICEAAGRPLPMLDDERMSTLCTMLMAAVPLALAYGGAAEPGRTARFVLSGPAGGTFTVPLGLEPGTGEPDVTIVSDAVSFCRVAIRRLDPGEMDAVIEGDRELGERVLAGVGALARD